MMTKIFFATFDGEVLHPEGPVDLSLHTRYVITIEQAKKIEDEIYPLTQILELATDMGITDLASRHDWYAHKQIEEKNHGPSH